MMATLPEDDTFPEGVYRIEMTDPVVGGAPNEATGAGLVNVPAMHLARRTRWLKTRVDALLAGFGAATTAVAGIVQLSTSTSSTSTTEAATPSAVKAAMDNANTRAPSARAVSAGGIAQGGGTLAADITINVIEATQAEAEAGTIQTRAMTPLRVAQAIAARIATGALQAGSALLTAIASVGSNGIIVKTGAGTALARAIAGSGNITVTNGDGIAANPTVSLSPYGVVVTDWDTVRSNGVYMAPGAANAPLPVQYPGAWWLGTVEAQADGWVTQTLHLFTSDSVADSITMRRSRDNGNWTTWYRLRLTEAEQAAITAASTIGNGHVWGDYTASRAIGGVYQNTTGRPMLVSIDITGNQQSGDLSVSTNNVTWLTVCGRSGDGNSEWLSTIVPHGSYYRLTGTVTITTWAELR